MVLNSFHGIVFRKWSVGISSVNIFRNMKTWRVWKSGVVETCKSGQKVSLESLFCDQSNLSKDVTSLTLPK